VDNWCHVFFLKWGSPCLCINQCIRALFRLYSTKIRQDHTSQYPKPPLNTYKSDNWWGNLSSWPRALKPHTTPHQLGIGGITESAYDKVGAHIRSSKPLASASCSRFRSRHCNQSWVHLHGKDLHSPCQVCHQCFHGTRQRSHPVRVQLHASPLIHTIVDVVDAMPLHHKGHPLVPLVDVQLQRWCSQGREDEDAPPSSNPWIWGFHRR
jgi:hypothetical protein